MYTQNFKNLITDDLACRIRNLAEPQNTPDDFLQSLSESIKNVALKKLFIKTSFATAPTVIAIANQPHRCNLPIAVATAINCAVRSLCSGDFKLITFINSRSRCKYV